MDRIFLLPLFLFLFVGCTGTTPPAQTADEGPAPDTAEVVDMHTSQIALDWAGTYEGVLPCADCEGIRTRLTITYALTYELETQYLGRSEEVFRRSGDFSWDDQGRTITLGGIDPAYETNHYQVGEERLFKLDRDGNRIRGEFEERYVLNKVD